MSRAKPAKVKFDRDEALHAIVYVEECANSVLTEYTERAYRIVASLARAQLQSLPTPPPAPGGREGEHGG